MAKIEVILPDGTRTLIDEAKRAAADDFYRKKYGKGISPVEGGDEKGQSLPPPPPTGVVDDKPAPQPPRDSKLKSLYEGARQGATFGFADEGTGAVGGALERLGLGADGVAEEFKPKSFAEAYRNHRDADRADSAKAKADNPWSFGAGEIAGSLPATIAGGGVAGKLAGGAGKVGQLAGRAEQAVSKLKPVAQAAVRGATSGAAQGAATGLGKSEKEGYLDNALDAVGGGLGGAALGGALGALGAKAGPAIIKYFKDKGLKADELRIMTAMGDTGGTMGTKVKLLEDIAKMPGGVAGFADWMRKNGYGRLKTATDIMTKADKGVAQSNDVIGKIINSVDDAGVKVSTDKMAAGLAGRAKELSHLPTEEGAARSMGELGGKFKERFPEGMSMREAQDNINALRDRVKWAREGRTPDAEQGARAAYRSLRESMDEAAPEALKGPVLDDVMASAQGMFPKGAPPPDASSLYKLARDARQKTGVLEEAARQSTDKAGKRRFSLMPDLKDMAGAALVAPVAGLSTPAVAGAIKVGRELYKPYSASARATFAEMAKKAGVVLDESGAAPAIGEGSKLIADAIRAGVLRKVTDDSGGGQR